MLNLSFPNNFIETNSLIPEDIWNALTLAPLVIIRNHKGRLDDRQWAFDFVSSLGTLGADELHITLDNVPKQRLSKFDIYTMDNKDPMFLSNSGYVESWHQDMTCVPKPTRFSVILNQSVEGNPHPQTEFKNLAATYKYSQYKEEAEDVLFTHFNTNIYTINNPTEEQYADLTHNHPLVQDFYGTKHYCFNPTFISMQKDEKIKELVSRINLESLNPMFHYKHRYQEGDILIWNQLMTNHRVLLRDEHKQRVNWRASFIDDKMENWYEQKDRN